MAKRNTAPTEKRARSTKPGRDEFFFVSAGIRVLSRVVDKRTRTETHYPFDPRDGSKKYKHVTCIVFKQVRPSDVHGVYKDWKRGYGFTRNLSPLVAFLEAYPTVNRVVIARAGKSRLAKTEIKLTTQDFEYLYQRIRPFRTQQTAELKSYTKAILADIIPSSVKKEATVYHPGELTRFIELRGLNSRNLSPNDIQSLGDLISSFPTDHKFVKGKSFISTKEKFDVISIEATLRDYRKLLGRKVETKKLEDSWHQFFKESSWILSQMFAAPMVLFKDKGYVGGKDIQNTGGKIVDFIYRNKLSMSSAIIEIKTHHTPLLDKAPYRKPDVFSISHQLSGAINQVLDQKDTMQKEYNSVMRSSEVESFDPLCIVLAGRFSSIKKECQKSFELFRSNSKGVTVVTFDELYERIETVLAIFRKKPILSRKGNLGLHHRARKRKVSMEG